MSGHAARSSSTPERPGAIRNRPRVSCTECVRRKTKCDRTEPCSSCRARGDTSTCHYAAIPPKADKRRRRVSTPRTAANGQASGSSQVAGSDFESGHTYGSDGLGTLQPRTTFPSRSSVKGNAIGPAVTTAKGNVDVLTEPAVWDMEDYLTGGSMSAKRDFTPRGYFQPLASNTSPSTGTGTGDVAADGIVKLTPAASRIIVPELRAPYDSLMEHCLNELNGCGLNVDLMVKRYFSHVAWHWHVLHQASFREEYGAFALFKAIGWQNRVDPLWISCLIMVLALTAHSYDTLDPTLFGTMTAEDLAQLPGKLFRLACITLECADWLGEPRLRTLQALGLINSYLLWDPSPESTGRLERYSVIAVRICRSLGLHNIADDPNKSPELDQAASELSSVLRREMALRIFYVTATLDLFNHRHRPALEQSDITSPLPGNYDDEDLSVDQKNPPLSRARLTDASFIIIHYHTGMLQREYQDSIQQESKPPLTLMSNVKSTIDSLMKRYRLMDTAPDETQQRAWARQMAKLNLWTRCVRLYRPWMSMDDESPEISSAREYMLSAARSLLGCACDLFASGAPLLRGSFHLMHVQSSSLVLMQRAWSRNEMLSTTDDALLSAALRLFQEYSQSLRPAIRRSGSFAVAVNQRLIQRLKDRHSFPGINESFAHALKHVTTSVRQELESEQMSSGTMDPIPLPSHMMMIEDPLEAWSWSFNTPLMGEFDANLTFA